MIPDSVKRPTSHSARKPPQTAKDSFQDRRAHGTLIAIQQSLIRESAFPTVSHYKVESIIYPDLIRSLLNN